MKFIEEIKKLRAEMTAMQHMRKSELEDLKHKIKVAFEATKFKPNSCIKILFEDVETVRTNCIMGPKQIMVPEKYQEFVTAWLRDNGFTLQYFVETEHTKNFSVNKKILKVTID